MIYEDIYRFLLNKASSKEVDILLHTLLNTDWNQSVKIDYYQLAKQSKTTKRYVKEVFDKFLSLSKGKRILSQNKMEGDNEYKLLIGKPNLLYNPGDRYCKKYAFLYSDAFKPLSIYSKRILIAAAMNVSNANSNETYIKKDYFVFNNELSSGLIPNIKTLKNSLKEIQGAFNGDILVSFVSTLPKRQEEIYIKFNKDLLGSVLHNNTEKRILKERLFENGYYTNLSDDHYIEIQKTGKYIFNSLFEYAKEESKSPRVKDIIDTSMRISRVIYNETINKVAKYISAHEFDLKDPKELSAYFSSVAFETVMEKAAKHSNQHNSIKQIYNRAVSGGELDNNYLLAVKERYTHHQVIAEILKKWLKDWVISRGITEIEEKKVDNDRNIEKIENLRTTITKVIKRVEDKTLKHSNNILTFEAKSRYIGEFKAYTDDHFDTLLYRLRKGLLAS